MYTVVYAYTNTNCIVQQYSSLIVSVGFTLYLYYQNHNEEVFQYMDDENNVFVTDQNVK